MTEESKPLNLQDLKTDKGFYCNADLGLPTIISKYGEIKEIRNELMIRKPGVTYDQGFLLGRPSPDLVDKSLDF